MKHGPIFLTLLFLAISTPLSGSLGGAEVKDLRAKSGTSTVGVNAVQDALNRLGGDVIQLNRIAASKELTPKHMSALRKHASNVRRDARIVSDYARRSGNTRAADLADRILIDDDVLGKLIINDDVTGKLIINDDILGRKVHIKQQIEVLNALTAELEKSGLTKRK